MLAGVLPASRHFARAIVMPNLVPPVVTGADARAYRDRIRAALPEGQDFTPLMTLYLTEATDPGDVAAAAADGLVAAVKLYPAGATTNSQSGVRDIARVMPVLERMAAIGLPLCVHGEVTDPEVDIFDREAVFVERVLAPLRARLPELRIVMEHVTTAEGVAFVEALCERRRDDHRPAPDARPQRPPRRRHPAALLLPAGAEARPAPRGAAAGGDRRRSAVLPRHRQRAAREGRPRRRPAAAPAASPRRWRSPAYAQVFDEEGALDRLEGFASLNGPAFYGLPPNEARVTLERLAEPAAMPTEVATGAGPVVVFDPGKPVIWRVRD